MLDDNIEDLNDEKYWHLSSKRYIALVLDYIEGRTEFSLNELATRTDAQSRSTFAHWLASIGYAINHAECLSWRDVFGDTVAHKLAARGFTFPTGHKVLYLKNNAGVTVKQLEQRYQAAEEASKNDKI